MLFCVGSSFSTSFTIQTSWMGSKSNSRPRRFQRNASGRFVLCWWAYVASAPSVLSVIVLRRALPAALAEIVRSHSRILAGKVFGARLNDAERNVAKFGRNG